MPQSMESPRVEYITNRVTEKQHKLLLSSRSIRNEKTEPEKGHKDVAVSGRREDFVGHEKFYTGSWEGGVLGWRAHEGVSTQSRFLPGCLGLQP